MKLHFTKEEKQFYSRWVLANSFSWPAGILLTLFLSYAVVNLIYPKETNLILGICLGGAVGYSQWLIIRKYIKISIWWIFAAAIGIGIPFVVGVILFEISGNEIRISDIEIIDQVIALFIGGFITGLLQYNLLKSVTPMYKRWIIISPFAWGISWLGLPFGGFFLGLITGFILIRYFDFPVHD